MSLHSIARRPKRSRRDEAYLRSVLNRAGVPHRRGLQARFLFVLGTIVQYPQRLLDSQKGEPRRRFTAVGIGVLSALGAILSVLWNQLILGCTFVAISLVNFLPSGLSSGRTPHPSNGSNGSSH